MDKANSWDPTIPEQEVRLRNNPGQRGVTTGKIMKSGSRLLVQVKFGPNEKTYKSYDLLELCSESSEGIADLLRQRHFSGPEELRRILTLEKLKGNLTNIFYSMESSNTDFYAHQFKPVLKFLESPVSRLLVADEVGLGKTIEAMYVWNELQVRADARRLLIICPAVLREKWRDDLKQRFNILADIVSAKDLLDKVRATLETQRPVSFACVASLEGLRPGSNWEDERSQDARSELARLLDSHPAQDEFGIFDLVIIDEAHYLRNPSTANNRMAQLMRDASRSFLLLTATPVQTHNTNLYHLLKLISPEDFFDEYIFREMLEANAPVVQALQLLGRNPPNLTAARKSLEQALTSRYFSQNPILQQIYQQLKDADRLSSEDFIKLSHRLENTSLVSQYITRSRKREVLPNRVERAPQTLRVSFSPLEQEVYELVTHYVRQQAVGQQGVPLFQLIARQRQMASCMAAALKAWSEEGIVDDLIQNEALWEDFGISFGLESDNSSSKPAIDWLNPSRLLDYRELEKQDTKYKALVRFLRQQLKQSPTEKFVLFAYFRGTLHYLQRRLTADGIPVRLIIGGMADKKWEVLKEFREGQASVLLSSEVGSEGIDLQFCRFLINYDLPWNPMRVEQRIGRLDRLGQTAERISIINFSLVDTIEEQILERLYDRIDVFRNSIGDLENILGEMTEKLLISLFEPQLTDAEREQKAEETARAILRQRLEQDRLESEAVNLLAFSDHILGAVAKSREQGRWISPQELHLLVEDFFARDYPGTVIEPVRGKADTFAITLSEEAKVAFKQFVVTHRYPTPTALHSQKVTCCFDLKVINDKEQQSRRIELLQPTHPLIQWIRHTYELQAHRFHPISAIQAKCEDVGLPSGLYVYSIYQWAFSGLRVENQLACKAARYQDGQMLSDEQSERLISEAASLGQVKPNAANLVDDFDRILTLYQNCEAYLEKSFEQASEEFDAENSNRCDVQQRSAENYADRRRQQLQERLERFQIEDKLRMVPATEGQLKKLARELEMKLSKINSRRDVSLDQVQLAAGLIFVD